MSDRLAIASAFSVLAMAAFALLGADAVRAPLAGETLRSPVMLSIGADLAPPAALARIAR